MSEGSPSEESSAYHSSDSDVDSLDDVPLMDPRTFAPPREDQLRPGPFAQLSLGANNQPTTRPTGFSLPSLSLQPAIAMQQQMLRQSEAQPRMQPSQPLQHVPEDTTEDESYESSLASSSLAETHHSTAGQQQHPPLTIRGLQDRPNLQTAPQPIHVRLLSVAFDHTPSLQGPGHAASSSTAQLSTQQQLLSSASAQLGIAQHELQLFCVRPLQARTSRLSDFCNRAAFSPVLPCPCFPVYDGCTELPPNGLAGLLCAG